MAATTTTTRISTEHYEAALDPEICTFAYEYLVENIQWVDGVPSRQGFTRKAKALTFDSDDVVSQLITEALKIVKVPHTGASVLDGIYLNWYRNGADFTPMHKHDTCQLIISLGASRTLKVGNRDIVMKNGDICIFGQSLHGVPKEPLQTEGRISIAVFLRQMPVDLLENVLAHSLSQLSF